MYYILDSDFLEKILQLFTQSSWLKAGIEEGLNVQTNMDGI